MKSKRVILTYITELEKQKNSYGANLTNIRNKIRLLQWALGIRTRPYPEGEGLMQKEDAKALTKENELRKKLKMGVRK